jgi:hypothetical protein
MNATAAAIDAAQNATEATANDGIQATPDTLQQKNLGEALAIFANAFRDGLGLPPESVASVMIEVASTLISAFEIDGQSQAAYHFLRTVGPEAADVIAGLLELANFPNRDEDPAGLSEPIMLAYAGALSAAGRHGNALGILARLLARSPDRPPLNHAMSVAEGRLAGLSRDRHAKDALRRKSPAIEGAAMQCNLCGGSTWLNMGNREGVRCAECGSLERTRAVKLVLEALGRPRHGDRILHFAPEKGLARLFKAISPQGYEPADFNPAIYPDASPRRFDLTTDCASLQTDCYDLILHMHVLEHVPVNIAHVLHHFHRALKPAGLHIFCIPIVDAPYDEYLGYLSQEQALRRFGQHDHVRTFGEKDLQRHLGSILRLKDAYSLRDYADDATLARFNIPEALRSGFNGNTIFVMQKNDYLLWP